MPRHPSSYLSQRPLKRRGAYGLLCSGSGWPANGSPRLSCDRTEHAAELSARTPSQHVHVQTQATNLATAGCGQLGGLGGDVVDCAQALLKVLGVWLPVERHENWRQMGEGKTHCCHRGLSKQLSRWSGGFCGFRIRALSWPWSVEVRCRR